MKGIVSADLYRLFKSSSFRLSLIVLLLMSSGLTFMQATGMDYTVPLSRVVFLPLSMYGLVMAAFISVFVGTEFSDGVIRNKILIANRRDDLVLSQVLVCCIASVIAYLSVIVFTTAIGLAFFENNLDGSTFIRYGLLGIVLSLATGCLFSVISMLCGNKVRAIVVCMGLAFIMLLLCLHTNEILVQAEYKDGALNPNYVGGPRRIVNSILHDLNPYGQAAQLSSWMVWHPLRAFLIDLFWIVELPVFGCLLFRKKNID